MNLALDDDTSKDLIKSILLHRIQFLRILDSFGSVVNCTTPSTEEQTLKDRFWKLKDRMNKWSWPVAAGREKVDENTKIPECNALYCLSCERQQEQPRDEEHGTTSIVADGYVASVWASFVETMEDEIKDEGFLPAEEDTETAPIPGFDLVDSVPTVACSRSKVNIFRGFSQGYGASFSDFRMPRLSDKVSKSVPLEDYGSLESRCAWKHILLDGARSGSDDDDSELSVNAWDLVKEHYLTTERSSGSSGESSPSASIGGSQSSSPRDQALPLSVAGEKRETIFSKLNNGKSAN